MRGMGRKSNYMYGAGRGWTTPGWLTMCKFSWGLSPHFGPLLPFSLGSEFNYNYHYFSHRTGNFAVKLGLGRVYIFFKYLQMGIFVQIPFAAGKHQRSIHLPALPVISVAAGKM